MTEDPRARRAAPDEGPADAGPTSGSTPSRAFESAGARTPAGDADLPFPANVRHRMAADDTAGGPSLRRSLGLTVVSTLIPGLGLLGARRGPPWGASSIWRTGPRRTPPGWPCWR